MKWKGPHKISCLRSWWGWGPHDDSTKSWWLGSWLFIISMIIEIIIIIFVIIIIWLVETGGRCTIFVAQMGVAGRAGRALQPSDSFLTLISEICCIHIYIYTLSYLQYIHRYTIHTIYTDIYIPTIYTNIYNYIQVVMRHMKERWLVSRHTTQNIMRNTRWRCRL